MKLEVRLKAKHQSTKSDQSSQRNPTMTSLLQAAASIYQVYYSNSAEPVQKPLGIAIHRATFRGKLIFAKRPVLLPEEWFFPTEQVEALLGSD